MNLEQFKLTEKVKMSYLKHRGNVIEISNELNLPLDYIKKMVKKFKTQEHRSVDVLIANNLMSHIMLGVESRCSHLMEMLRSLEKAERPFISVCCNGHFKTIHDSYTGITHRCSACKAICDIYQPPKASVYKIKLEILERLQEEDLGLVDMADKMGYTNKIEPTPTIINHKPNVLIVGDASKEQQQAIVDYSQLDPMDREKLIEKLRKEIVQEEDAVVTERPPVTEATEAPAEIPPGPHTL